jgi:hypothetical protein
MCAVKIVCICTFGGAESKNATDIIPTKIKKMRDNLIKNAMFVGLFCLFSDRQS